MCWRKPLSAPRQKGQRVVCLRKGAKWGWALETARRSFRGRGWVGLRRRNEKSCVWGLFEWACALETASRASGESVRVAQTVEIARRVFVGSVHVGVDCRRRVSGFLGKRLSGPEP